MNISFKRLQRGSWFSLGCLAAIVLILIYNAGMVACGHCTIASLLRIPWLGWVLIVTNLLAGLALVIVQRCHRHKLPENCCVLCDATMYESWGYCPKCGVARG
jgi:hypothetical protein